MRNQISKIKLHTAINTHIGVEPQLANIARDDLLLLGDQADTKRVVDNGLLHGVHLRERHTAEVGGQRAAEGQPSGSDESDVDRVTGLSLFFTVRVRRWRQQRHISCTPLGCTATRARTHTHACTQPEKCLEKLSRTTNRNSQAARAKTHTHTMSYRVKIWKEADWRCRLNRKWQKWLHDHRGPCGANETRQGSAHRATPTS